MAKMGIFSWVLFWIVIIGGLNWGLIGFFQFNLVQWIFGVGAMARIIYSTVGIATVIGAGIALAKN